MRVAQEHIPFLSQEALDWLTQNDPDAGYAEEDLEDVTRSTVYATEAVWEEAKRFEESLESALVRWGEANRDKLVEGIEPEDLMDGGAAGIDVVLTLQGHGAGIWDGRWDHFFKNPTESIEELRQVLDAELGDYVGEGFEGSLGEAFNEAVHETMEGVPAEYWELGPDEYMKQQKESGTIGNPDLGKTDNDDPVGYWASGGKLNLQDWEAGLDRKTGSWASEFGSDYDVPGEVEALVQAGYVFDDSWHNDVCPSFVISGTETEAYDGYKLWVEHVNPDLREWAGEGDRFVITDGANGHEPVLETDDINKAVAKVKELYGEATGKTSREAQELQVDGKPITFDAWIDKWTVDNQGKQTDDWWVRGPRASIIVFDSASHEFEALAAPHPKGLLESLGIFDSRATAMEALQGYYGDSGQGVDMKETGMDVQTWEASLEKGGQDGEGGPRLVYEPADGGFWFSDSWRTIQREDDELYSPEDTIDLLVRDHGYTEEEAQTVADEAVGNERGMEINPEVRTSIGVRERQAQANPANIAWEQFAGPSSLRVTMGSTSLWFSYKTLVAFNTPGTGLVIRENDWSSTTGNHLNAVDRDVEKRISGEEFEALVEQTFA